MNLTERFQAGIKRYGYDSDFRKQVEAIVSKENVLYEELIKCFEKFGV